MNGQDDKTLRAPAGTAFPLREFERLTGALTREDQLRVVEQALLLMEQHYVHLPLKRAMHAVDPVQSLRLLRFRVEQGEVPTELDFHKEMARIFNSVRDLHTNYLLPQPYSGYTAFLPFLVEECYDADGRPRHLVTKVAPGIEHADFRAGVEVTAWNGVPIARAVELNGERQPGGNREAKLARGLAALTLRPLVRVLPPDEEWVVVSFRTAEEAPRELEARFAWQVFTTQRAPGAVNPDAPTAEAAAQASDILLDEINEARKALFAPAAVVAEWAVAAGDEATARPGGDALETTLPGTLKARAVETSHGTFAHVRIFNFSVSDADSFVDEFVRLAAQLPQDGMILDVRGNGGGLLFAGEQLLQVLTPRAIEPAPAQFLNTPQNLELCRLNPGPELYLGRWLPSIEQAVETGAQYSAAFPITDPAKANRLGQRYQGPVVLVTDALCYSTTDMMVAGFQDHAIGPVIGTSGNTGAGGANVWTHGLLTRLAQGKGPYEELPAGVNLRVAIRRTLRSGARAGTPVEDLGVQPDHLYRMTTSDLLDDNRGLLEFAAGILAKLPVRRLEARAARDAEGRMQVTATTRGLQRVDVFADGRPRDSRDVADGTHTFTLDVPPGAALLELRGYDGALLAAATRIPLAAPAAPPQPGTAAPPQPGPAAPGTTTPGATSP